MSHISKFGNSQIIKVENIHDSPFQVRKRYGDIERLAQNIEKHGLLQPILVRPVSEGYEVVHGHRRLTAVRSIGWSYIQAFIKELSDSEAIVIQGSENLKRKDYDPIEEATLYRNYKDYVLKETGRRIGDEEIAETFDSSRSSVKDKLGLLDLPESVQNKIIEGTIPFSKAVALVTLTREVDGDASPSEKLPGVEYKPRTNRFYSEIEALSIEIEKGDKGGLRTKNGVGHAVDLILEDRPIDEAIDQAKLRESISRAKKQSEAGKPPKEIIQSILASQQDPQTVLDATMQAERDNLGKLLEQGFLKCPYCGGDDLEWSCKHAKVVKNEQTN